MRGGSLLLQRLGALGLAMGLSLAASSALAQAPDPATRATARKLGADAVKLFEAGDYAGALDKFNTADRLVPAPTLGLYAARSLVKLGRLVEASERYLDASRMQLEKGPTLAVMRKAQADAITEREKLLPTIPTVTIRVEGPAGDGVKVAVDEHVIPAEAVGVPRPVDPGDHEITATRSDARASEKVSFELGAAREVTLKLPALPPPPAPPVAVMPLSRKLGWAFVGVGAAGATMAVASGVIAVVKEGGLKDKCPDELHCPKSQAPAIRSYDLAREFTTAGVVMGVVGVAISVPLLIVSPREVYEYPDGRPAPAPSEKARVEVYTTGAFAGLRGVF